MAITLGMILEYGVIVAGPGTFVYGRLIFHQSQRVQKGLNTERGIQSCFWVVKTVLPDRHNPHYVLAVGRHLLCGFRGEYKQTGGAAGKNCRSPPDLMMPIVL